MDTHANPDYCNMRPLDSNSLVFWTLFIYMQTKIGVNIGVQIHRKFGNFLGEILGHFCVYGNKILQAMNTTPYSVDEMQITS